MRIRNAVGGALFVLSTIATLLAGGGPAVGQAAEPCPPGQPFDRPPGQPTNPPGQPADRPIQYPPGKCQLRLSRSVVAPGGSLQAAGSGFAPGSTVEVAMAGASLGSSTADGGGAFTSTVVVPSSAAPGTHAVTATGPAAAGGTQVLSASVTVTADASTDGATSARAGGSGITGGPAGQSLPSTGSSSPVPLALAGGALLAVGLGVVVVARRRAGSV